MNRNEWLKSRQKSIGSSDAAALHNESPYKTALGIYEDKIAEEIIEETSFAMDRGNQFEPIARALFAAEYGLDNMISEEFHARNVVSEDLPFMAASLDGCSADMKTICEIKYQGLKNHESGEIPKHYWIQIQHQLLVSGAELSYFVSYNPDSQTVLKYQKVYRDEEFMVNHVKVCTDFWLNHVEKRVPPEAANKDYVTLKVKGMAEMAHRYEILKERADEIEKEMKEIKEEILTHVTHPKMRIGNLRIVKIDRIGNINYKKIPAVAAMKDEELDKYRSKTSTSYRMDIES